MVLSGLHTRHIVLQEGLSLSAGGVETKQLGQARTVRRILHDSQFDAENNIYVVIFKLDTNILFVYLNGLILL